MELGLEWKPGPLDLSLGPQMVETKERNQKFFEEALKFLPKPMQTLLEALRDLKCDMAKDREIKKENEFNLYESKISELVAKVLQIAEAKLTATKAIVVPVSEQIKELKLNEKFALLIQKEQSVKETEWLEILEKELSIARKEYYANLENKKSYLTKTMDFSSSIEEASRAVSASEAMRRRLINLAQGPLSCLFEDESGTKIVKTKDQEEPTTSLHEQASSEESKTKLECLAQRVKDLSMFIIQVRAVFQKLNSQKILDTTHLTFEAIESIKALRNSVSEPTPQTVIENASLSKADKKIQAEVSLLLATLTVDRQSLETVLRNIKNECESIKNKYDYELAAEIYKTLKHIQATYANASQIFLSSF